MQYPLPVGSEGVVCLCSGIQAKGLCLCLCPCNSSPHPGSDPPLQKQNKMP